YSRRIEPMDAHAPHKPVLTLKGALVELAIVTAGVLIALSFDGIREWHANRALAAEAHANLVTEIRRNKAEIDQSIAGLDGALKNYFHAHDVVQSLLDHQPLGEKEMTIGFNLAQLSTAAYATAEVTG